LISAQLVSTIFLQNKNLSKIGGSTTNEQENSMDKQANSYNPNKSKSLIFQIKRNMEFILGHQFLNLN
jgi:hypothetical protein